jgi:hypothetical protein
MFSRPEWENLKRQKEFKEKLKSAKTLKDIEGLGAIDAQLLRDWEDRNPKRAKFKRRTSTVRKPKSKSQTASPLWLTKKQPSRLPFNKR